MRELESAPTDRSLRVVFWNGMSGEAPEKRLLDAAVEVRASKPGAPAQQCGFLLLPDCSLSLIPLPFAHAPGREIAFGPSRCRRGSGRRLKAFVRRQVFKEKYSGWVGPVTASYAPGRVNIIGEHTDYNAGFVFPMCLDLGTAVVGAKASGSEVRIYSMAKQLEICCGVSEACKVEDAEKGEWSSYIKGCIAKFGEGYQELQGKPFDCPAFSAVIEASIPMGSGLSSSASVEVALMTFLEELTGCRLQPAAKARLCQAAEREYANVPCGIMDQLISCIGKQGHAAMIDCRSLQAESVPVGNSSVTFLITNSQVKHVLTESEYPKRVASCQEALAAINKHMGA